MGGAAQRPIGPVDSESRRDHGAHEFTAQTLADLERMLRSCEAAARANASHAAALNAQGKAADAMWYSMQAAGCTFQVDSERQPDLAKLKAICYDRFGEFNHTAVARLRAALVLSGKHGVAAIVERMPIRDAVDALSKPNVDKREPMELSPVEERDRFESDGQTILRLLRVFTNGLADNRLAEAAAVLTDDSLTANAKLMQIDRAIRFPCTASAEQLGKMLGVSKQAVQRTQWWKQNRHGEKANEIGRRRNGHRDRATRHEFDQNACDDESG